MIGSLEIEIITSKTGMAQDPQSYIVGVEVRGLQEEWIYEESKGYQHVVSVSTRELLPQQLSAQVFSILDNISGQLFYPMTLKAQSSMLEVGISTAVAVAMLVMS
jgi:hypothetical protein